MPHLKLNPALPSWEIFLFVPRSLLILSIMFLLPVYAQSNSTALVENTQKTSSKLQKGVAVKSTEQRKDQYIWAYTEKFRRRTNMPRDRLVDDLGDAQAIIWRLESTGHLYCEGTEGKQCRPLNECLIDVYFGPEATAKLSLKDQSALLPWKSSARFLLDNNPELKKYAEASVDLPKINWKTNGSSIELLRYEHSQRTYEFTKFVAQIDCALALKNVSKPAQIELSHGEGELNVNIPEQFWQEAQQIATDKGNLKTLKLDRRSPQDIGLWLATPAFAEEFGLPEENVSSELLDAAAIVFRTEPNGLARYTSCRYDIFFPSNRKLVYTSDQRMEFFFSWDSQHLPKKKNRKSRPHLNGTASWNELDIAGASLNGINVNSNDKQKFYSTTLNVDRYWKSDVLIPGYQMLSVRKHCSAGEIEGWKEVIAFSRNARAPHGKYIYEDSKQIIQSAGLPEDYVSEYHSKVKNYEYCLNKQLFGFKVSNYAANERYCKLGKEEDSKSVFGRLVEFLKFLN